MDRKLAALFILLAFAASITGCGSSPAGRIPVPDFSIAISQRSVFVAIGQTSESVQVSVQGINGFYRPVRITVTEMPAGVTTTPRGPFALYPGASQTVTFSSAPEAQPVVQTVWFQAVSGMLAHNGSLSLSVTHPVYAYVTSLPVAMDGSDEQIVVYSVNAESGTLAKLPIAPTKVAGHAEKMLATSLSGGTFLFVASSYSISGRVAAYGEILRMDATTGALTLVETPVGLSPKFVIHPSGRFLYTPVSNIYDLSSKPCIWRSIIDPATGHLSSGQCLELGVDLVLAGEKFAYGQDPNDVVRGYSVDQNDGSLMPLNIPPLPGRSLLASDPAGRALYTLNFDVSPSCGVVEMWTIDSSSGSLTSVPQAYGTMPCGIDSMAFTPTGNFAYLDGWFQNGNGVYWHLGFNVDSTTGSLAQIVGSPFQPPLPTWSPDSKVEPTKGKFLFNALCTSGLVSFPIDPNTGALGPPVSAATDLSCPDYFALVEAHQ